MKNKKLGNLWKEWKWTVILLSICIAGIPITTIYGIQSVNWGNDFWPNALSEFLGMFVDLIFGAIFTFVVIDKYLQYHKNKQWKKIKKITYKNLYFNLSDILLKLNLVFPKEMQIESYVLTEDMETLNDYLPKEDFNVFATSLSQNIDKLIQESHVEKIDETTSFKNEEIHASLSKFKQHTKSDINSISVIIIPKLLNFSDNIEMLDNLIELEELFTSLMSKISSIHRKNSNGNIKYLWLLKIKEILNIIKSISDSIQNEIELD